jgi:hypothetical protein
MIGRLLGTHVQRLATIAHGDGVCTTHIPPAAAGTSTTTALLPPRARTETPDDLPQAGGPSSIRMSTAAATMATADHPHEPTTSAGGRS